MAWLIKQTIDLSRGDRVGDKQQAIRPLAYPGNENAHRWEVKVLDNGIPVSLSGYSVSAEFDRQDGNRVASVTSCVTENAAWVLFPADVYNIEGMVNARMSISKSSETVTIAAISFRVSHRNNGPIIDPQGVITLDAAQLVDQINTAVGSIPPEYTALLNTIAPNFSTSTAYTAGEYVWYSGTLRRFTADHPAGAWIGTDATAAVIGDVLESFKSALKILGTSNFTKASGNAHSATADKATGLSIASGEKFCIMYSRPTTNWTYFYGYDSSGNQVGGGSLLSTNLSEGFNIITAPGDIASIGWADSSTTSSGEYKFAIFAYNSVFSDAYEALQLSEYVVPIVDTYCYCKNIIGPEPGVLYPCDILPNTALVMSTADGNNITTNNTNINFYDANKTRIKGFNFYNGTSSRAFTYDGASTAKYVAFTGNQCPLQLERGSTKTTYQPYFSNADNLSRIVNAGYINYLLSSADVVAATLINGVPSPNTSRIYSREFNVVAGDYISFDNSSNTKLRYTIVYYNADGTFDSQTEWLDERVPNVIFTESKKIRILIGTSDYSAISDVESAANSIAVHISEVNQLRLIYGETAYVKPADDIDPKLQEFAAKYIGAGEATSFVFFTDPHILSAGGKSAFYDKLHTYTRKINDYYSQLSTSFILCGGDWLEWNDTPADALWKLNLMQGRVRELFGDHYYPVFGNHDNNYQGTEVDGVKALSRAILRDVMFPYWANTYYTFAMPEARFYVLDSGTDWGQSMDVDDRWTQIAWLAEQLTENDDPHSAIFMHILWNSSSATGIAQFADNVQQLVGAYNNHSTITLNGVSYDFTGCTGKVGFILGGHLHADKSDTTSYSVPVIATINTQAGSGSFDLVIADWTNGKLHMVRVGSGDNRTFDIVV